MTSTEHCDTFLFGKASETQKNYSVYFSVPQSELWLDPFSDSFFSDSRPPLWQLTDLHLSIMQALEEAQGSPDKLQSAAGVNLVREGLELFTAFKSLKKII